MAKLTGFSLPAMNAPRGDHTYAASDKGHAWGCFGRSIGGTKICSGRGSATVADCLSNPNGTAGIVYGVTGVCHQAANRILYPASSLVDAAHGYKMSVALWTTYGRGDWPELQHCLPPTGTLGGNTSSNMKTQKKIDSHSGDSSMSNKNRADGYRDRINELYALNDESNIFPVDTASMETAIAADVSLGKDISHEELLKVISYQQEMRQSQKELARSFGSGWMNVDDYYESVLSLMTRTFTQCEDILGKHRFSTMFGGTPNDVASFFDKETLKNNLPLNSKGRFDRKQTNQFSPGENI